MKVSLIVLALAAQAAAASPEFGGALWRSVFHDQPIAAATIERLSDTQRQRVRQYLERRRTLRVELGPVPTGGELGSIHEKKTRLARSAAALIDTPGIDQRAATYFREARISYEWEGLPDPPLAEAAYAEDALRKIPDTPLKPFLYVFLAHRYRSAFEGRDATDAERVTSARKYQTFLQRARAAEDPIFGWIADDLDARKFLYADIGKHPRDVLPVG